MLCFLLKTSIGRARKLSLLYVTDYDILNHVLTKSATGADFCNLIHVLYCADEASVEASASEAAAPASSEEADEASDEASAASATFPPSTTSVSS